MVGFYDYTVVLTYMGLLFSIFGMFQAIDGSFFSAMFCLGIALICDGADGRVARRKRNRTKQEAMFGVQIDSLCDVVSFGAFPAVLCYCIGLRDILGVLISSYFCLCCVIRLGYFNVLGQETDDGIQTEYHGLPVNCFSLVVPTLYMVRFWVPESIFFWLLRIALLIFGTLYILDFKFIKPKPAILLSLPCIYYLQLAFITMYGRG